MLDSVDAFARGARAAVLNEARRIIRAFEAAENEVLFPMLARVRLRTDLQHLLVDVQQDRADQLAEVSALSRKRGKLTRRVAAVRLSHLIRVAEERRTCQLIPSLASCLPRVQYRALARAFIQRYESALGGAAAGRELARHVA